MQDASINKCLYGEGLCAQNTDAQSWGIVSTKDFVSQEIVRYVTTKLEEIKGYQASHRTRILKELGVELVRFSLAAGVIYLGVFSQSDEEKGGSPDSQQMKMAFLIGPMLSNALSNSIFNICRKTALLLCPSLATPAMKKAADYRTQFEEKKLSYSPAMQAFLDQTITRYSFILEQFGFDVKELSNAIEEALRLPVRPKCLEKKNPKINAILQNYSSEVKQQVARLVAEIITHSSVEKPSKRITPALLKGPPGTGKTHLVRQLAKALELPFCEFKISEYRSINGNNMWSNDPERGVVLDALLKASLDQPQNPASNIILFLDEPDKVLEKGKNEIFTHPTGNAVNTFLHTLLESGTVDFPLQRFFNADHSIRHMIVFLGVNRGFTEVLGQEGGQALETRVRTISFDKGFDREKKRALVADFIQEKYRELKIDESSIPIDKGVIEKILNKDEEAKIKGVRILFDVVNEYIHSIINKDDVAFYADAEMAPFDVNGAYAEHLPKKKEKEEERPGYIN